MSKPQNGFNLVTPADRKSAPLEHKLTATKGEFKATNPVPAFLQQAAPDSTPIEFARNISGVVIKQSATNEPNTSGKPMRARIYVFWNALNSRLFYSVSIVENGNHRRVYGHQDITVARQWLQDNGYTEAFAPYYSREVQQHIMDNEVKAAEVTSVSAETVDSMVGYCQSYGNAHLHKSDTPFGTMVRVSGESKYLCPECIAFRAKALASQEYPSANKAQVQTKQPIKTCNKKPSKAQVRELDRLINAGCAVTTLSDYKQHTSIRICVERDWIEVSYPDKYRQAWMITEAGKQAWRITSEYAQLMDDELSTNVSAS